MKLNLSFKLKILLSNLSLLTIFGGVLFFQYNNSLSNQKIEIRKNFQTNAEKLGSSVSQSFFYYYHNVQAISKNETLKSKNPESIQFLLNEMVSLYPVYDFILVTDLEGKVVGVNSLSAKGKKLSTSNIIGKSFSSSKWFSEVKADKLTVDYKKKIFGSRVGELENSSIAKDLYGEELPGFHISTTVQDEYGDPLAIVTTFVGTRWLDSEVDELASTINKSEDANAITLLVDKNQTVLGSSNDKYEIGKKIDENIHLDQTKIEEPSFWESLFSEDKPLTAVNQLDGNKFLSQLGWTAYIEMQSKTAFAGILQSKRIFTFSFLAALLFSGVVAFLLSRMLANRMADISENVGKGAQNVNSASEDIKRQAELLSGSTNEQASSLQETVSSLNEISAMVQRNNDHTKNSKRLSSDSRESANGGMATLEDLLTAIKEIAGTNNEIIGQINENAKEMGDITKVIKDIEQKTRVINDIVFQTKLLSFNASVEAARAGEHGKGFSVVAEEVGTLAKSSGEAADEIEELLIKSLDTVNRMVEGTKSKVDRLVAKSSEKVEVGNQVAEQCKTALKSIVDQSVSLDQAIEEIANASVEQTLGIQEITKAMDQLDTVTRQNSEIANVLSDGANSLNSQVDHLKGLSLDLTELVFGTVDVDKAQVKALNTPKKSNIDDETPSNKNTTNKSDNVVAFEAPKKDVENFNTSQVSDESEDEEKWEVI